MTFKANMHWEMQNEQKWKSHVYEQAFIQAKFLLLFFFVGQFERHKGPFWSVGGVLCPHVTQRSLLYTFGVKSLVSVIYVTDHLFRTILHPLVAQHKGSGLSLQLLPKPMALQ